VTPLAIAAVGIVAFLASGVSLFAGFGLGTLLLPVFALAFPAQVAVGATAVVHGLNSLFKAVLVGREADRGVVVRFGLPAVAAAFGGAAVLAALAERPPIVLTWPGGRTTSVPPVQMGMGVLILVFAVLELLPQAVKWSLPPRFLPLGGVLSGFFGGLSGHQGALRAIFLRRAGLSPSAFVGTQAVLACLVDSARLLVYGAAAWRARFSGLAVHGTLLAVTVGTLCGFLGAYAGSRFFTKVTIGALQKIVGISLMAVGAGLAAGVF
jgi:uncharacterized membrane protein YfcA